jgi:carbamoyl-phosphate synthase large subunit
MHHVAVKEAVLPFGRFPGVDMILGPEMRSTGEVMGIDAGLGLAFAKSQAAGGWGLPTKGTVFVSVADRDKPAIVKCVRMLAEMGFDVVSTAGTGGHLGAAGIPVRTVGKYSEGPGSIVEEILAGGIDLVINTPHGRGPRADGYEIRAAAVRRNIPYVTTMEAVRATVAGIDALRRGALTVRSLQEYLAPHGSSSPEKPPKETSPKEPSR